LARGGELGIVLLLVYWVLKLPVLGLEITRAAWQYPAHRNVTLRLLEPLVAPEEAIPDKASPSEKEEAPVSLTLEGVSVRAAGHTILEDIELDIQAGSHVAVVGSSGAGKTTLFGLLLGWHRPSNGRVLVEGHRLEGKILARLRSETAWVDPTVQLWNRTFLENLFYGANRVPSLPLSSVIEQAELRKVLEALPDGLQTELGEGGGLVSGGEGQRVRLGRAFLRPQVRLVLMDEPFRGMDRQQRAELLARSRRFWKETTLLCVTHDLQETKSFDRVLVMEGGRIVEDDSPHELAGRPDSRYRALLESEAALKKLWSDDWWRHWRLDGGQVIETSRRVSHK
jgi:ATP-binding cassette subfamily B protein